jgi:uncharacterized protein YbjT (DUF2867 family)
MILVTGATGTLGTVLVPRLAAGGETVRALSRKPPREAGAAQWLTGDLASGAGLDTALDGVDAVVHAASDTRAARSGDLAATEQLIAAAKRSPHPPHLVYISIVGVDRDRHGYFRAKFDCEQAIEASGLPHTILRTTQWFQLLDKAFGAAVKLPLMPIPNLPVQPLDVTEAADRLAVIAGGEPLGRAEDMGGPEVLAVPDAAKQFARAAGRKRVVVPFWLPGRIGAAFRAGVHLAPGHEAGTMTWAEHLAERFGE